MTLLLLMNFLPFPGERQFLRFIRANYRDLFPQLIDQSQFNHRARAWRLLVKEIHRNWMASLGTWMLPHSFWTPNRCQSWATNGTRRRVSWAVRRPITCMPVKI